MKTLLSLLIFFSTYAHANCDFRAEVRSLYSLSGPMTVILKDLGLLKKNQVKGISIFHPINKKDFSGKLYPGGIFLAKNILEEFRNGYVYYDESRELSKILKSSPASKTVSIKTRGLRPLAVAELLITEVQAITQNCETQLHTWKEKNKKLLVSISKLLSQKMNVVYFLGNFKNGRFPEMIIANDGIVKWLREEKLINTYPSELPYVNWSPKVLKSMPLNTKFIGIKDSGRELTKSIQREGKGVNLIYPGVLIPGITQLEGWKYLLEQY